MPALEMKSNSALKSVLFLLLSLLFAVVLLIGAKLALSGSLASFSGVAPTNLGIQSGQLAPCPSTPNCVSSFAKDSEHKIEPLTYTSAPEVAFNDLKSVIKNLERTKIITETDNYLDAEFTSQLMGFVDDVEFYLDKAENVIHVRSASRLGESDLGVNRQRIEKMRSLLNQAQTQRVSTSDYKL